jgi:hypothetical protein
LPPRVPEPIPSDFWAKPKGDLCGKNSGSPVLDGTFMQFFFATNAREFSRIDLKIRAIREIRG